MLNKKLVTLFIIVILAILILYVLIPSKQKDSQITNLHEASNIPLVSGAYLLINVVDSNGNPITNGTIVNEYTIYETSPLQNAETYARNYSFNISLVQIVRNNNLKYFEPCPFDPVRPQACLEVNTFYIVNAVGQTSDRWTITNKDYWEAVKMSTKGYAMEHTFILPSR